MGSGHWLCGCITGKNTTKHHDEHSTPCYSTGRDLGAWLLPRRACACPLLPRRCCCQPATPPAGNQQEAPGPPCLREPLGSSTSSSGLRPTCGLAGCQLAWGRLASAQCVAPRPQGWAGHLLMMTSQGQEHAPFNASACVTPADIPLAKTSHVTEHRHNGWEMHASFSWQAQQGPVAKRGEERRH